MDGQSIVSVAVISMLKDRYERALSRKVFWYEGTENKMRFTPFGAKELPPVEFTGSRELKLISNCLWEMPIGLVP